MLCANFRGRKNEQRELSAILFLLAALFADRHHAVPSGLQLLRIANTWSEKGTRVHLLPRSEIPVVRGQRRPARLTCRRNCLGKLERVHAPTSEDLMRIPHQPNTVSRICHEVGGYYCPLTAVMRLWLLAIPNHCLGDVRFRLGKSILVEQKLIQPALAHETLHRRKRLVPIEI